MRGPAAGAADAVAPPVIPEGAGSAPAPSPPDRDQAVPLAASVESVFTPCSASARKEFRPLIRSAPSTAPDSSNATDDEHRQRREGELNGHLVGVIEPSSCTSRPPAKPARAPLMTNA